MKTLRGGVRTARGRVTCSVCGRRIARGTRYYFQTCADYRDIWDWRQCPACEEFERRLPCYLERTDWCEGSSDCYVEHASDVLDVPDGLVSAMLLCEMDSPVGYRERDAELLRRSVAERSAEADRLDHDPAHAWGDDAWAAFRWLMATSTSLHPDGVREAVLA